jgi:hypothetical protein
VNNVGHINGRQFATRENVILPDEYEWTKTEQFTVYVWLTPPREGGNDEHNDCLWNALMKAMRIREIPMNFRSPLLLKEALGLQRDDKISIELFPKMEKLMKINLHCTGDATYTSCESFIRTIHLKLSNGHYTLCNHQKKDMTKRNCHKEQPLILYIIKNKQNVIACDGEECHKQTLLTFQQEKQECGDFGEVAYYETDSKIKKENEQIEYKTEKDLIEEYANILRNVEELHKASIEQGLEINLKKFHYSIHEACQYLFNHFSRSIQEPEEISDIEAKWLDDCTSGGLIYAVDDTNVENAYQYDIVSCYPSFMSSTYFQFPTTKGDFKQIGFLPNILPFGLYKCEITGTPSPLFRFNKTNIYSHHDIKQALNLGFQVSLIIKENEPNHVAYPKKRMNGHTLFHEMITYLFKLKKRKVPYAKLIINRIWGMLCERNKLKQTSRKDKEIHFDNAEIISIRENNKDSFTFEYIKNDKPYYKHSWARIGCFLLAYTRLKVGDALMPYQERIKRIHTDGCVVDGEISELKLGDDLGNWKLEKRGCCYIKNMSSVIWNEKN